MKRGQTTATINGHDIELIQISDGWTVWIDGKLCTAGIVHPQIFRTKRDAHGHALRRTRAA